MNSGSSRDSSPSRNLLLEGMEEFFMGKDNFHEGGAGFPSIKKKKN